MGPLYTGRPNTRMALGIPLALPTLAALTPDRHSVRIIDEEVQELDFDEPVDLVGITAMTFKATRAYEISREFRSRGVRVVMGGIHATMCPEEALNHVDSVVIGEAEDIWADLIDDAEAGGLQRTYRAPALPDLTRSPIPRYSLVANRQYLFTYLQTARGCPFNCRFCSVTKVAGHKVRKKTPGQVIDEVDHVLGLSVVRPIPVIDRLSGQRKKLVGTLAFIDDNFAIDRDHALAVCSRLEQYQAERGIVFTWYTQVNYMVGFDEELLSALARSNCQYLFIGFENLDPDALRAMNKKMNDPLRYGEAIANIHRHGMRVAFSTIIGDDHTSPRSALILESFARKNHLVHVLLNILTPYPGTELAREMMQEGRILSGRPELYNIRNVVFRPRNLSVTQLTDIYLSLCNSIFSYRSVFERGREQLKEMNRFVIPLLYRLPVCSVFLFVCLTLAVRGKLRWPVAIRLFTTAPRFLLVTGSLYSLELLVASADYDDFLQSESRRIGTPRKTDHSLAELIQSHIESHYCNRIPAREDRKVPTKKLRYRAFRVGQDQLSPIGVRLAAENIGRPVLLLGGTSIPISDRMGLIEDLITSGYEVASIENESGSPFDFQSNPSLDRLAALHHFLEYLAGKKEVHALDIVAQSYSAFETIRVLLASPRFSTLVRSITLINPPGFNEDISFPGHVARFCLHHVTKGYVKATASLFGTTASRQEAGSPWERRRNSRKEVMGISIWGVRTVANLTRTFKEVRDIVTFRLRNPIEVLQKRYDYDINVFLQSGDQVVPARKTREALTGLLPDDHLCITPGGHNDLFFQDRQRASFLSFLSTIRNRTGSRDAPGQQSGDGPMAQPVTPSTHPSIHQPSRTEKLRTPL